MEKNELLRELQNRILDCLTFSESIQNQVKDLIDEIKAIDEICQELSDG